MPEPRGPAMQEPQSRFCEMMQEIDRLYEAYAKSRGMTYLSMTVLEAIYSSPDSCTQKQICEQTHYPKQSVNLIIKAFWQEGLVRLEELPEDRRNKRVVLTEKGQTYADRMVGTLWSIDEEASAQLTCQQQEQLLMMMERYLFTYRQGIQNAMQESTGGVE